jgi:hypothetical protein
MDMDELTKVTLAIIAAALAVIAANDFRLEVIIWCIVAVVISWVLYICSFER